MKKTDYTSTFDPLDAIAKQLEAEKKKIYKPLKDRGPERSEQEKQDFSEAFRRSTRWKTK